MFDDSLLSMLEYGAEPKEMDQAGAVWSSSNQSSENTSNLLMLL